MRTNISSHQNQQFYNVIAHLHRITQTAHFPTSLHNRACNRRTLDVIDVATLSEKPSGSESITSLSASGT